MEHLKRFKIYLVYAGKFQSTTKAGKKVIIQPDPK
ncbi:hypothetical protein JOD45_003318 [Scopulibacillus daqui]|uniref:Uncharacterized protein n=1 Tax=Scopulibacillus daqui TaxID=1469162 RepID=A0ABS2Q440_9BACL|nr:hypothetical protein [Scopulibacillus daqui]